MLFPFAAVFIFVWDTAGGTLAGSKFCALTVEGEAYILLNQKLCQSFQETGMLQLPVFCGRMCLLEKKVFYGTVLQEKKDTPFLPLPEPLTG